MVRFILFLILASLAVAVRAETLVTDARILEVTERGFILRVGTEPLVVESSPETRYWANFGPGTRTSFKKETTVGVRIKTDTDPPMLKEIGDLPTWNWLLQIRKEPMRATIEKVEPKTLKVKLADGRPFEFRMSDKTEIKLGGKPAGSTDLATGSTVYVKGRLLPTLDTWLEKVWDVPIPAKASAAKPKKEAPAAPIPLTGRLEGPMLIHLPPLKIFDILDGTRTLHITYRSTTKFTLDGRNVGPEALSKDQRAVVQYSRDKTGRILASKVELFSPRAG